MNSAVEIDTMLNILGLAISVGGLIAARVKRQTVFLIVAIALVLTTGTALVTEYMHHRQISHVQEMIADKLLGNRWTFERIYQEMHFVPYPLLREALFLAVDSGKIGDSPTECTMNDGSVLSTRVYYMGPDRKR
jgi:hypothetical protein